MFRNYLLAGVLLGFLIGIAHGQSLPQATISWVSNQDPKNPETGFKLERKLGPVGSTSPWTQVGGNIAAGVTSLIDTTILANQEYCYRISAFNATGSSGFSNMACGTAVVLTVPAIPTLTLKMNTASGIAPLAVAWTAPTNPKPTAKDWVALYPAAGTDQQYIGGNQCAKAQCWQYTNAAPSGTFTVTPPAAGTYNVRYLVNDGYTSVMKSYDVVVK
jgi:hypothetical protein